MCTKAFLDLESRENPTLATTYISGLLPRLGFAGGVMSCGTRVVAVILRSKTEKIKTVVCNRVELAMQNIHKIAKIKTCPLIYMHDQEHFNLIRTYSTIN